MSLTALTIEIRYLCQTVDTPGYLSVASPLRFGHPKPPLRLSLSLSLSRPSSPSHSRIHFRPPTPLFIHHIHSHPPIRQTLFLSASWCSSFNVRSMFTTHFILIPPSLPHTSHLTASPHVHLTTHSPAAEADQFHAATRRGAQSATPPPTRATLKAVCG